MLVSSNSLDLPVTKAEELTPLPIWTTRRDGKLAWSVIWNGVACIADDTCAKSFCSCRPDGVRPTTHIFSSAGQTEWRLARRDQLHCFKRTRKESRVEVAALQ